MNTAKIKNLVRQHLMAWSEFKNITIVNSNIRTNPVNDGMWGRITFQFSSTTVSGMANTPCTREMGAVVLQFFDSPSNGTAELDRVCDSLGDHMKFYTIDKLELSEASVQDVGLTANGDFYQYNVRIPFRYN